MILTQTTNVVKICLSLIQYELCLVNIIQNIGGGYKYVDVMFVYKDIKNLEII